MSFVMTLLAKGSAIVYVILQLWILVPVFDVMGCCGPHRKTILIQAAISFAFFTKEPGTLEHFLGPGFVSSGLIVFVVWHIHLMQPTRSPPRALSRSASLWLKERKSQYQICK